MPNTKEKLRFLRQKRNLLLLALWCMMIVALVVGITLNAVRFFNGEIEDVDVYHRLWFTLLCFVLISLPYLIEMIFRIRFSLFLEIALPLLAFSALGIGTVYGVYELFFLWDKLLHGAGGLIFTFTGFTLAWFLLKPYPEGKRKIVIAAVIAVLSALAVIYLWEIFEFSVNRNMASASDTAWDMISSLIGAVVFLVPALISLFENPERLEIFAVKKQNKQQDE